MNQPIVSPESEQKPDSTREEKKVFPKKEPFLVRMEIMSPRTRKVRSFVNRRVEAWQELSPQRKRAIVLASSSALLATTMSLLAGRMARRIMRKRAVKAVPSEK